MVAGRSDQCATRNVANHPGQHVTVAPPVQRRLDVRLRPAGLRHRREPQLPQLPVGRRRLERVVMGLAQRLETNAVSIQGDRLRIDHARMLQAKQADG